MYRKMSSVHGSSVLTVKERDSFTLQLLYLGLITHQLFWKGTRQGSNKW